MHGTEIENDCTKVFNTKSPSNSDDDSWQNFHDNNRDDDRSESSWEAVTSDVTSQGKDEVRLYDEKVEEKCEKGSSVHLTDGHLYWKVQGKEGYFDGFNVDSV